MNKNGSKNETQNNEEHDSSERVVDEDVEKECRKWVKRQMKIYSIIDEEFENAGKQKKESEKNLLKQESTQPLHYWLQKNIEWYRKKTQSVSLPSINNGITPDQIEYMEDLLENKRNQVLFAQRLSKEDVSEIDMDERKIIKLLRDPEKTAEEKRKTRLKLLKMLTSKQASRLITKMTDG